MRRKLGLNLTVSVGSSREKGPELVLDEMQEPKPQTKVFTVGDVISIPFNNQEQGTASKITVKILSEINKGRFGTVYKVVDQSDPSKEYALKVVDEDMNHQLMLRGNAIKKAQSELPIEQDILRKEFENSKSARLEVIASASHEGNSFALMSLGEDLGQVNEQDIVDLLQDLKNIHDSGHVHGDIKKDNLKRFKGLVSFVDFGESYHIDRPPEYIRTDNEDTFAEDDPKKKDVIALGKALKTLVEEETISADIPCLGDLIKKMVAGECSSVDQCLDLLSPPA